MRCCGRWLLGCLRRVARRQEPAARDRELGATPLSQRAREIYSTARLTTATDGLVRLVGVLAYAPAHGSEALRE